MIMNKSSYFEGDSSKSRPLTNIPESDEVATETAFDKYTGEMDRSETVKKEIMLGKRVGLYRIKGDLGNGNFSQVKLAIHLLTREEVAVKILDKTKLDAKTQRLLSGEIASMERLHHPNVIRLYEVIEDFHKLHIVMEYASGGELHSLIVNHGKIPEQIAKLIFTQVVAAMNHLHRTGVIHRDLKAENIFFAGNKLENGYSDTGAAKTSSSTALSNSAEYSFSRLIHVKLGDFGFSTIALSTDRLTTFCGSPPYAAPELFQADWYYGPKVDIWAMGILLYFMLCGTMPFRGESVGVLKRLILAGQYSCPQWLHLPVRHLIQQLLRQSADERLSVEQIMNHEWLLGQNFPEPYQAFKSTPSVPEIETRHDDDDDLACTQQPGDVFEADSREASQMLSRLGITDKHIEVAQAQAVRNYVTGTYRIMLHRVHRNRRMSHIPQSLSNPELGDKYFNSSRQRPGPHGRKPRTVSGRSKTSTRSEEPAGSHHKASKMCTLL